MFMDTNSHKEIKCIIENYSYESHMTSLNSNYKSASSNSRTDRSRNIVDVIGEHRLINKGLFSKPMI